MDKSISRRGFVKGVAGSAAALALLPQRLRGELLKSAYTSPNVVLVRFGGGVRRQEVLQASTTWAPYFLKELAPQGTLYSRMEISEMGGDPAEKLDTSHSQGTMFLLTGKYEKHRDIEDGFLASRFESSVPTLFEYLRTAYDLAPHEALLINGEDRTDEEFYTFSNMHQFGYDVRGEALSLYRFKVWKLRRELAGTGLDEKTRRQKAQELAKMESIDYRIKGGLEYAPAMERFWESWADYYGRDGFRNPRGDQLLAELTVRAMEQLQPRLTMVNFQDSDYVHWGNPSHYTRGIAIIDGCIRRLVEASQRLDAYRDNTVFVIVPDCGRDDNKLVRVPYQHHFNSRSSHEIFCLVMGPGVPKGRVVDRLVNQVQVAATIGGIMRMPTAHTEGEALKEALG